MQTKKKEKEKQLGMAFLCTSFDEVNTKDPFSDVCPSSIVSWESGHTLELSVGSIKKPLG